MKKKILSFLLVCLVLPCAFLLAGCGEVRMDAGDRIANASIYDWATYTSGEYTAAAVQIDFDKVNIADIQSMKVVMYVGQDKVGEATCKGDQITFYWENYGIYWTDAEGKALTGETWQNCAGKQWLECYFTPTTEVRNDEDWTMEYTGKVNVKPTSFDFELTAKENGKTIVYTYTFEA